MPRRMTYRAAGVHVAAADLFEEMIAERVKMAWPDMDGQIGRFAGRGRIPAGATEIAGSTDGTGSKISIAALLGEFDDIGQDGVAMAAVDAYVDGSRPLFICDTIKVYRLRPELHITIIDSIIKGCFLAGCRLFGGETAERPDLFRHPWMADLDVTAYAFPEPESAYAPVEAGQKVYGWPSYGVACNGFSLVRRVFGLQQPKAARRRLLHYYQTLGTTLAEALLQPTPIWIKEAKMQRVRGVRFARHAHITGGGMLGNIPRILPPHCKVVIWRGAWRRPPIFSLMQRKGYIAGEEMDAVFNNGIIMVSIVAREGKDMDDENAVLIGYVSARENGEPQVELTGSYRDE